MIGIGINKKVGFGKDTTVNEAKGWLVLQFKQNGGFTEEEKNQMSFDGIEIPQEVSLKQTVFPPKTDAYDDKGNKSGRKAAAAINEDVQKHIKWLSKFLEIYLSKETIDAEFGLGLIKSIIKAKTVEELINYLSTDTNVTNLYTDIYKTFVAVLNKHNIIESKIKFDLKLWRQSEKSTFTTIPTGKDIWIEPSNIPEGAKCKMSITDWDKSPIKRGSTVTRVSTEAISADVIPPQEIQASATLFSDDVSSFPDNLPDNPLI